MLSGLGPDTPFGRVVALRREVRPDVLKRLSAAERKMRTDWLRHVRQVGTNTMPSMGTDRLQDALEACFGNTKRGRGCAWPQSM